MGERETFPTLEDRILAAIVEGKVRFTDIDARARALNEGSFWSTDRILQRLRRERRISFSHRFGWSIVSR